MARIDNIREYVETYFAQTGKTGKPQGVTANQVAEAMGIWRNDASAELNKLYAQGYLRKQGKKPVVYYPVSNEGRLPTREAPEQSIPVSAMGVQNRETVHQGLDAFSNLIGARGSLKSQIQMAKAAVLYPPNGLHMLITGESGVGKSLFAKEIWRFSNQADRKRTEPRPFVLFNCAEYAENPQLLQSHLFGYAKGAFTGANADTPGLVEKASGGILFLDEIHRLPPTGQEMLFTLIDEGIFRRLGETVNRKAHLMVIGATTESISSVMLQTFRRRIPVLVELPPLIQRPIQERIALIQYFLIQESNRLNRPIFLSGPTCNSILCADTKANIGDLKNLLQLCCARSYCMYLTGAGEEELLRVDVDALPVGIQRQNEKVMPVKEVSRGILAFPHTSSPNNADCDEDSSMNLYRFVEKRLQAYRLNATAPKEMDQLIARDLELYYDSAVRARENFHDAAQSGWISQEELDTADGILTLASAHFNRVYPSNIKVSLAMHLSQFCQRASRGEPALDTRLSCMLPRYENEISFIRSILPRITEKLKVNIPEEEIGFLAMFIRTPDSVHASRAGILVVVSGESTASSMVGYVRKFLSADNVIPVDIPFGTSRDTIIERLCEASRLCLTQKGILLLTDIDTYAAMSGEVSRRTGVLCRGIPGANVALLTEAVKLASASQESADELYRRLLDRYREYLSALFPEGIHAAAGYPEELPAMDDEDANVILAVCATGIGSARTIAELLRERLTFTGDITVAPMSVAEDLPKAIASYGSSLVAVVGSFPPNADQVPYFSTEDILLGNGLRDLDALIQHRMDQMGNDRALPRSREYALVRIAGQIQRFAPSFDKKRVMDAAVNIADRIAGELLTAPMPVDMLVRVVLHTASLLERMQSRNQAPMPQWGDEWLAQHSRETIILRSILNDVFRDFDFTISDAELVFFQQIF